MKKYLSVTEWGSGMPMMEPAPTFAVKDTANFVDGLKETLGSILAVNAFIRAYPALFYALHMNTSWTWEDMSELMADSRSTGVLTVDQYNKVLRLAAKHNIPITSEAQN